MAHQLLPSEVEIKEAKKQRRFNLPVFEGKFGFSLFIGSKEVFIGLSIGHVEIERIVRKKLLKVPKNATVKVFKFDSL